MAAFDPTPLLHFQLVGVRFSKLIVDEGATPLLGGQELTVQIMRSVPELSPHRYSDRPVIELKVGVVATAESKGAEQTLDKVFHIECTAGFVGSAPDFDGDLDAFKECIEPYARAIYWMLRERLDSVFAVTSMRGTSLPWDINPREMSPADSKVTVSKKRASAKKKASS